MRKIFINSILGLTLAASMTSCGDKFLETEYFAGVDVDEPLNSSATIEVALNGGYYMLFYYTFAGNYATTLGDIASDIVYWTGNNSHQNDLYQFNYQETSTTLYYIWDYGYKTVNAAARVVQSAEELIPTLDDENDAAWTMILEAEGRTMRAYANLALVNIFAHQVMVDGTSYANMPGIVLVDEPVEPFVNVTRATIGETYDFILDDLYKAIDLFENSNYVYANRYIFNDRTPFYGINYFGVASAYGLLARTLTYLEQWQDAAEAAEMAIAWSGIDELAYSSQAYTNLYSGGDSNWESMFALGIDANNNWSANSCGTLFSTYGYSISPYLVSLLDDTDCRYDLYTNFTLTANAPTAYSDNYYGAKFCYGGGNKAVATNYLINAPEMFLIMAEAYANLGQISEAQDALFVVAHRNSAIEDPDQVGTTASQILSFLHDERARELFQEGHRFFDLRRWNIDCSTYAVSAPTIAWAIDNVKLGDVVLPIPVDEINAGYGVTQNEGWQNTRP